jgi:hypothetical protein
MTNSGFNVHDLTPVFRSVSHYDGPADVLADANLSQPEKRAILSSWASDMYAPESAPALRQIPGMDRPIRLSEILSALRELDGDSDDDPPPPGGLPMRLRRRRAAAAGSPA